MSSKVHPRSDKLREALIADEQIRSLKNSFS